VTNHRAANNRQEADGFSCLFFLHFMNLAQ
jgi:hypothetical protein